MNLTRLVGNAQLKERLERQWQRGGLLHACIVCGQKGIGKRTLARLLAAALVCDGQHEKPCFVCNPCRKAEKNIHPDIISLTDDPVLVNSIRTLRSDAWVRPNEGRAKVYIIEHADSMNPSAQNAFLKLLEEGPDYAAFFLISEHAEQLLETIRSRCVVLSLSPVSTKEAHLWLKEKFSECEEEKIRQVAHSCGGILGTAIQILREEEEQNPLASEWMTGLEKRDVFSLLPLIPQLEKYKREEMISFLEQLSAMLGARLRQEAGAHPGHGLETLTRKELVGIIEQIKILRTACERNAGAGHVVGWLLAGCEEILGGTP